MSLIHRPGDSYMNKLAVIFRNKCRQENIFLSNVILLQEFSVITSSQKQNTNLMVGEWGNELRLDTIHIISAQGRGDLVKSPEIE